MEQKEFSLYVSSILKIYKEKHLQYHCKKEYCCGLCDRFYTCILYLTEEIKQHTLKSQQKYRNWQDKRSIL